MKRRFFLPAMLALCLLTSCTVPSAKPEPEPVTAELFAMDTYMSLVAYGDEAQDALTEASQVINDLDRTLSRTREGSDVWNLNHAGSVVPSADTAVLLNAALRYTADTEGCFDITIAPLVEAWGITTDSPRVPSQEEIDALLKKVGPQHLLLTADMARLDKGCAVDLGAIAKGYAGDAVADVFSRYGVESGAVSLGGNVYVCGTRPDGNPWQVAIQDPQGEGYACTLLLSDAFAVTSGGYQRYFTGPDGTVYQHILDPAPGRPAQSDLLSVTVVCPNGTRADAYSTALYVMGEQRAWQFWEARDGGDRAFDMVLVTADGRLVVTPGLADRFQEEESAPYEVHFITR